MLQDVSHHILSNSQNIDRQMDELQKLGLSPKQIYTDKQSEKDFNRENIRNLRKD